MILVDTSVWIEHFRYNIDELHVPLQADQVLMHPYVIGELACGYLADRLDTLQFFESIPKVTMAEHSEVLELIQRYRLWGLGMGWVDANLLASAVIASVGLWTRDKRLASIAATLEIIVN